VDEEAFGIMKFNETTSAQHPNFFLGGGGCLHISATVEASKFKRRK